MRIDAFLEQSPLYAASRAAREVDSRLRRIPGLDGLSLFEALLLAAILLEEPESVKPSHLAGAFDTARGNVSHWISSLEGKGLLQRRVDSGDARSLAIQLKPPGRKRAMQVVRVFDRMQRRFEKEIGASELRRAIDVIRRVEILCGD